ncbi:MAG: helix-turn-helix transcriptional regulator [Candidatus Krumholzibacteriota bacterium]|nr:helix-turn-helix transcriptional regulator [Candidatus Krumholzibacteriota bacterium]
MITKEEIGRRIKKIREQMHMTLKNVEAKANISATHISEIERGKTSPTIGALLRIANALGKDPAYFIEDEELEDVSFVSLEDRQKMTLGRAEGVVEMLTNSIPSGKINAQLITLAPSEKTEFSLHEHNCDESSLVLKGNVIFMIDNERYELKEGDSIYYIASQPHGYINASTEEEAKMIWFASERGVD